MSPVKPEHENQKQPDSRTKTGYHEHLGNSTKQHRNK